MHEFSLLGLIEDQLKLTPDPAYPAGPDLPLSTRDYDLGHVLFTRRAPDLLRWCRVHEDAVMTQMARHAEVYAGFQKLSRLRQPGTYQRYATLAQSASRVCVFGAPDVVVDLPRVCAVAIDTGPLLQEWFLVVSGSAYSAVLVARDLTGFGGSAPLRERHFQGIVTFRSSDTNAAVDALREVVWGD